MWKLRKILSEIIISKPDILQFAKDGKYEECWIIPLTQSKPSGKKIKDYLQKDKFKTLIVEYIWNSCDDSHRFVLTLFLDKKCQLQDPKKFINISLDLFYDYQDFKTFIQVIDNKIIRREYLLNNPVDSIGIGIFNHWFSVGPAELWSKGDKYNIDIIKSKILAHPEIEKTTLNYQGLVFRFNTDGNLNGPFYGIKTPCCNKIGNKWTVDFKKIDYWIKLMLNVQKS